MVVVVGVAGLGGGLVEGARVRGDRVKRGLSGAVYHWAATYEDLYPC